MPSLSEVDAVQDLLPCDVSPFETGASPFFYSTEATSSVAFSENMPAKLAGHTLAVLNWETVNFRGIRGEDENLSAFSCSHEK